MRQTTDDADRHGLEDRGGFEALFAGLGWWLMAIAAEPTSERHPLRVLRRPALGRVRLNVAGLHRHPERAADVEAALTALFGVRLASASHLTGNALVIYDPNETDEPAILDAGARRLAEVLSANVAAPAPRANVRQNDQTVASAEPRWHAREAADVARILGVDVARGLSSDEVAARRAELGPNRLPEPREPSLIATFLGQFANAPSALLAAGAILSVATGGLVDAVLIGAVLVANASIGTVTERSGHRAIAALRRSVAIQARVRRDGEELTLPADDLVPGDMIRLRIGDPIPADARVVAAHRLLVEESALTGESRAVEKAEAPVDLVAPLAERDSMLYRGTIVVGGHGEAIVVETGGRTVLGELRALAAAAQPPPAPLERDLDALGRGMAAGSVALTAGLTGLAVLRGFNPLAAVTTAVALAIAAIPEGLPAIATTVLALGSGRMRRKGTLIRSLPAAESLGSVSVVCADKTGTLTENRMAVRECLVDGHSVVITGSALARRGHFRVGGVAVAPELIPGLREALRIGALCTDAEAIGTETGGETEKDGEQVRIEGSATEAALLVAAVKAGLDPIALARDLPRIDRRDRGNGRRYMVTVHRRGSGSNTPVPGSSRPGSPGPEGQGYRAGSPCPEGQGYGPSVVSDPIGSRPFTAESSMPLPFRAGTVRAGTDPAGTDPAGIPPGRLVAFAKGSPEAIVDLCDRIAHGDRVVRLIAPTRRKLLDCNAEMGGRGLRVLGLASRELPEDYTDDDLARGFVWHGEIGLADPVRPAVPAAIRSLHRAGIRTVMITGDQAPTATAIARDLRLSRRGSLESVEAAELASLPPEILRDRVRDVGIFARVQPEQKLLVVRALQEGGDIVAMTGDGVNDAAALRAADVGVAMGQSGTELARELSDVVLSTDDFASFVDAVEEGRLVRRNVQRVLHYLLATNASEVWLVGGGIALGLASPLTPLQLLWLNVVSDVGPAVGLATEPAPSDLMARPPRDPREPLVTKSLRRRIVGESLAIALGGLGVYGAGLLRYGAGPVAQTMAFGSMMTAQLLHVSLARTGDRSVESDGAPRNPKLALGVGVSALLQAAALFFPPLRAALGGAAIGLGGLLISLAGAILPILGINLVRALGAPRRRAPLRLLPPVNHGD